MDTTTINISMPQSMKLDVEEIIASEGYGNTSEFFRDLIRTYQRRRRELIIETLFLEGINSGPATPLTHADFEEIKRRGIERIKNRKK